MQKMLSNQTDGVAIQAAPFSFLMKATALSQGQA